MSSIGLSGISGISENTLQLRYEKALKQINKLIQINRQLKESTHGQQEQVEKLMEEVRRLEQVNRQLDEENNILESKYMELEGHYHQLEVYCKELTDKFEMHQMEQDHYDQKIRQAESKYHQELQNETVKYNELAREAELINQIYQENLSTLQINNKKNKDLQQENKELNLRNTKLSEENAQLSYIIKQKNVQHLKRQLDKAQETIETLIKECNELKNKQIDIQVMDERKKVQKFIGMSAFNDPRQNDAVRQLIQEYKKKIRNLENQKKDMEYKYKKLKSHSCHVVPEESYLRKIEGLERLTEKQHKEISRIIETYDKEFINISKENLKLKEGCLSLSQQLTKKSMDLQEKQKLIAQLRYTTDRINIDSKSSNKSNHLIEVNADRLKDLPRKDLPHAQSFTIFDKKNSEDLAITLGDHDISMKKKLQSPTGDGIFAKQSMLGSGQSYLSPRSDGDFKFIQSVNIINGYNVSLGDQKHKHGHY